MVTASRQKAEINAFTGLDDSGLLGLGLLE